MTIQRTPHPVFAALWLAWSIYMIVCVWLNTWTHDIILWTTWMLIEGTAARLNTGMRDTHSEIATWVHRNLSKGPFARVPYRGWNALLFMPYIGLIGLNLFQMFQGHGAVMEAFGAFCACSVCAGLWEHWIHPDRSG